MIQYSDGSSTRISFKFWLKGYAVWHKHVSPSTKVANGMETKSLYIYDVGGKYKLAR